MVSLHTRKQIPQIATHHLSVLSLLALGANSGHHQAESSNATRTGLQRSYSQPAPSASRRSSCLVGGQAHLLSHVTTDQNTTKWTDRTHTFSYRHVAPHLAMQFLEFAHRRCSTTSTVAQRASQNRHTAAVRSDPDTISMLHRNQYAQRALTTNVQPNGAGLRGSTILDPDEQANWLRPRRGCVLELLPILRFVECQWPPA